MIFTEKRTLAAHVIIQTVQWRSTALCASMKLLTHNFLQCHIKGVKNGYPLKIEAVKVDERDADFDPGLSTAGAALAACQHDCDGSHGGSDACFLLTDFLRSMFKRIDWKAFVEGAQAVRSSGLVITHTSTLFQPAIDSRPTPI